MKLLILCVWTTFLCGCSQEQSPTKVGNPWQLSGQASPATSGIFTLNDAELLVRTEHWHYISRTEIRIFPIPDEHRTPDTPTLKSYEDLKVDGVIRDERTWFVAIPSDGFADGNARLFQVPHLGEPRRGVALYSLEIGGNPVSLYLAYNARGSIQITIYSDHLIQPFMNDCFQPEIHYIDKSMRLPEICRREYELWGRGATTQPGRENAVYDWRGHEIQ